MSWVRVLHRCRGRRCPWLCGCSPEAGVGASGLFLWATFEASVGFNFVALIFMQSTPGRVSKFPLKSAFQRAGSFDLKR